MKETILGVDVSTDNYDSLTSKLLKKIDNREKAFIVAINPEKIIKAQDDPSLMKLLNSADFQIPDGIGVILASKFKGGQIRERVTGIDMMLKLCETAAKHQKKIFLYGGKPGRADEAKVKLKEMYPGIQIAGTLHGYEKDQQVVHEAINQSQADIIFVAMGSPAQENWIIANKETLHPSVYQGVGGSFDVISGKIERAPESFQKLGLEWLYRLMKEPWRIKRQAVLPLFLIRAITSKK
ncbi:WecB/TagA/CpsF family glycosyltransferase [Pseudoneobacillus rhizosphaerae]|uniref:N-acetylglucosaminyldiphosphoundecaprenol N-acetyl-beta-D-mannosaminyltransferase n=1 Tax=Pseudoneobacillus rhizosphaerae TaxID=2880968 RepID=A0A9C7G618_9BACI|nr:WecB/TagA/CpsF family glycosyltransferase [Pseudoneobacillus rhizosphaerae]CAG9606621.1 N-acetylglucosaminyldiphosphoundecaprenol N-acetyl-beta-D-mannosaminyltransferase [Pseudoneobacillus rhizosphaerae]